MIQRVITFFIRPTLRCAAAVWNQNLKNHIEKSEKVQRAARRWVPGLREFSNEGQLATLERRRKRGDMIMLYTLKEKNRLM